MKFGTGVCRLLTKTTALSEHHTNCLRCIIKRYKARLEEFWMHQKVKFDFNADLIGTGDRPGQIESGIV